MRIPTRNPIHAADEIAWRNLADLLTEGVQKGPPHPSFAICFNISKLRRKNTFPHPEFGEYSRLWRDWPLYSGNIQYPIPYCTPKRACTGEPDWAAALFKKTEEYWKGRQGELRRDLCAYMAQRIYQELE